MELEEDKVGERMGLYKKTSGLIFDDGFHSGSLNSRYSLSPEDAPTLDISQNQLVIPHTDSETMVLFSVPENEQTLIFEVTADYIPQEVGDEGGILIWHDGYHRLEFLESKDSTTREYSKWRAQKEGNRWTFYANRGSGWELFDSANVEALKMGVVLKNPEKLNYDALKLDRWILCRSNKITIGNLPQGYTIYLCDSSGYMIHSATVEPLWTGVELDLPILPYHGILKVFDENGVQLSSIGPVDLYGGDMYLYGTDLRVLWKGEELNLTNDTYLGTMYDHVIEVQMELYNPSNNKAATGITMGILKYLEEFGYEWADICHDDGQDKPSGNYTQKLDMGTLGPLDKMKFWMKVERKSERFGIKPIHFILDITHL
ncbi:cell adhesion protein [Paenibacillus sp. HJL G12]|uniref:Cell adhesion protein n=1 Tax=Paenibacillus dendrobii TaxID=2691084 RepID=A0A7X3LH20_9BACL|nr:cell adhesion protein [Paenibacillus dendrobii]MWV43088.1 cell adhesion protein [Paenibacillus dendrobii]